MHATGFQILFLIFAVQFGSMLVGYPGGAAVGMTPKQVELFTQALPFIFAGAFVLAIPPIRSECARFLSVPVQRSQWPEIAIATALKLAVPFGIVGVIAATAIFSGDAGTLSRITIETEPDLQLASVTTPTALFFTVVFSWLVGPILEEIFFRGFLYRAWERQWGWLPAMTLTSISFGLFHPHHIASSFFASVIFTCLLRRTGSLRASIYAHSVHNILAFWPLFGHLVFAVRPGEPMAWSTWTVDIACFIAITIGVPLYLFLARRPHEASLARS